MNFNVDRIAQLAGLTAGNTGSSGSGVLRESAARPARPASTYDRVVEELQLRGLEMFYTPEQINEAIRSERRILSEEREMEMEGAHPEVEGMHMHSYDEGMHKDAGDEGMHYEEDVVEVLRREEDEMASYDEGMDDLEAGTVVKTPKGGEFKVTKKGTGGTSAALAEAKLRKLIGNEVDRVLAEMSNSGDTSWMYPDGKRPVSKGKGAAMGFAGPGFKR
jgi:hypothetical protein